MSEISSVRATERATVEPVAAVPAARPVQDPSHDKRLDPAVTVDLSGDAKSDQPARSEAEYRSQFVRDQQSRQIVYQVVDPASGDIVVQLPSVTVLKSRAYAEAKAAAQAASQPPVATGQPQQRPVDRIA